MSKTGLRCCPAVRAVLLSALGFMRAEGADTNRPPASPQNDQRLLKNIDTLKSAVPSGKLVPAVATLEAELATLWEWEEQGQRPLDPEVVFSVVKNGYKTEGIYINGYGDADGQDRVARKRREKGVRNHLPGTGPPGASHKWFLTPFSRTWLTRAASISLGAGLLIGVLSTSLVWAFALPRVAGPFRIPLPLVDSSFEEQFFVGHRGIPSQPGDWGGDFARITGREQGIVPKDGQHMLRFLRSNFEGEVSELSYVGNMYQVVDLRPWKDAFANGQTRVELTAWFNAVPGEANSKFRFGAQLFALEDSPVDLSTPSSSGWLTPNNVAFSGHRNVWADDDSATWQRVTTELRLPPQTQFLLVHVEVARSQLSRESIEFAGHYVDAMELVLNTERKPL